MKSALPDVARRPIWADAVGTAASSLAKAAQRPEPLTEYEGRIFAFAEEVLGVPRETLIWSLNAAYEDHDWDGTPDPIAEMGRAVEAGEDVAVESGTGTGKSFTAAVGVLYFLAVYENSRTFTLAPKEDQLSDYIWKEIDHLWPAFKRRFPTAEKTHLRIRMQKGVKGWDAQARTVGVGADEWSATKARGMHAEHMMIVCEEATGIHKAVMTAVQQTCTAPHNFIIAFGNPDHQFDGLHQFAVKDRVKHVIASSLDHPNVVLGDPNFISGAVSQKFLDDRAEDHPPGSRLWEAHIRGRSPAESAEALIRRAWLEEAAARYSDPALREWGAPALGVDVARSEDGDHAAIARGIGACLLEVSSFPCDDAVALGVRIKAEMLLQDVADDHCGIDTGGGYGAGTVDKLKELGRRVRGLNGGERAIPKIDRDVWVEKGKPIREEETYLNLRAQMWWQMRMDLQRGRVAIPEDDELWQDLVTPEWTTRNGKIVVEPKEEIVKRLGRSPDKGDAAVYWNWVRERPQIPEEEEDLSAWDPEVLEHEALEGRRVRSKPPAREDDLNPILIERL